MELVGQIIIARILGALTEALLEMRHQRILQTAKTTACKKLRLDDLQTKAPTYADIEKQRSINVELHALEFKIAIVVPETQMAYLARLKFSHENHRIFYFDLAEAISWLMHEDAA